MGKRNLNDYIKKSHIRAVEKFNEELDAWAKETGDNAAVLYEDANISFTLSHVHVMEGCLCYTYDGHDEHETIVLKDDDTKRYYEIEDIEGIMEWIKFWRKCLRRAKRYWAMDPDKLDKIQDGEAEDIDLEED